jgi:GNAT superfamily N-acetyltransferase
MTDPVLLRPVVPSDLGYILSTWLRDLRDADPSGLPDDLWFPAHRALVERTLADRSVAAIVACAADAPTEILAYIVAEPGVALEWIHVRKPLRNKGLAKRLLSAVSSPDQPFPARWQTSSSKTRLRVKSQGRRLRRDRPRLPAKR